MSGLSVTVQLFNSPCTYVARILLISTLHIINDKVDVPREELLELVLDEQHLLSEERHDETVVERHTEHGHVTRVGQGGGAEEEAVDGPRVVLLGVP